MCPTQWTKIVTVNVPSTVDFVCDCNSALHSVTKNGTFTVDYECDCHCTLPNVITSSTVDCEWAKNCEVIMDCQKNQESMFKEEETNCYFLQFSEEINKWSDIEKLKDELIERMLNKEVEEDENDNKDPKSMKKRLRSTCGKKGSRRRKDRKKRRSNACRKTRKIINAFKRDLAMVYKLTTRVSLTT